MILTRNRRLYLPPNYRIDQEAERESEKRTKEEKRKARKKANEILVKDFGARAVPTPPGNIITFDKGADGVIANAAVVPGETSAKGFSGTNGVITQTAGVGKVDTIQTGNAFAWIQGQNDINASTWKIKSQCDITALNGANMEIVLIGITGSARSAAFDWTGGAALITAGITVAKQTQAGLNIRFTYNNSGARIIPGFFTDKWPLATTTPIKYEIESNGVCLIFRFDTNAILGATEVCSVLLTSVTFGAGLFPFCGQPIDFVNWEMIEEFDNMEGWG